MLDQDGGGRPGRILERGPQKVGKGQAGNTMGLTGPHEPEAVLGGGKGGGWRRESTSSADFSNLHLSELEEIREEVVRSSSLAIKIKRNSSTDTFATEMTSLGSFDSSSSAATHGYESFSTSPTTRNCHGCRERRWVTGRKYEIIPALYFMAISDMRKLREVSEWEQATGRVLDTFFFSMDDYIQYEPFFEDFGPISIPSIHNFSIDLDRILKEQQAMGKHVVLVANSSPADRTNAATLIAAYLVYSQGMTPEEAWEPFVFTFGKDPFMPYCDASACAGYFALPPQSVVEGLHLGISQGIAFPRADFDLDSYLELEKLDCCEIVKGRFMILKGPMDSFSRTKGNEAKETDPSEYINAFRLRNVSAVIRLNMEEYQPSVFHNAGINHYDLQFNGALLPSQEILSRFFDICSSEEGMIAIHCKNGIGRSALLVATWLMRKCAFTSEQVIGYSRTMWPGSIVGIQQEFLADNEEFFHMWGDPDKDDGREAAAVSLKAKERTVSPAEGEIRMLRGKSASQLSLSQLSLEGRSCDSSRSSIRAENTTLVLYVRKESAVRLARKARENATMAKRRMARIMASKAADEQEESMGKAKNKSFYSKFKSTFKIFKGGRTKKPPLDIISSLIEGSTSC